MSDRFTVLIADFLDETSIESAILDDIAKIIMARARDESELAEYLPHADAILLFHDISIVGEPSFSRAPRCRCVVRAGVGLQQRRRRGRDSARRDRLQRARLRHRGSRRSRHHVPAGDRAPAGAIARGDPGGNLGLSDRRGRAAPARQDLRRDRLRPDRHGNGPASQGTGARRRLLRPVPAPGDGQGAGSPPRLSARRPARAEPFCQPPLLSRRDEPAHDKRTRPSRGCDRARC